MTRTSGITSLRAVVGALAAAALLLVLSAERGAAYTKPPGGTWRSEDLGFVARKRG